MPDIESVLSEHSDEICSQNILDVDDDDDWDCQSIIVEEEDEEKDHQDETQEPTALLCSQKHLMSHPRYFGLWDMEEASTLKTNMKNMVQTAQKKKQHLNPL